MSGQIRELEVFPPKTSRSSHLLGGCPRVQLVIDLNLDVVLLFLTQAFTFQDAQFEAAIRSAPVFGQHEGLFETLNPFVPLLGILAGEVPRGARRRVRDLEPSILADNGRMNRLNGNVLSVQMKPIDEILENRRKYFLKNY